MIDKKITDELRGKHAPTELHVLTSKTCEAVFRSPDRADWKRFRAAGKDDRYASYEALSKDCALYVEGQTSLEPDEARIAVDALFERKPGLAESWGAQLVELAGLEEVTAKKL